MSRVARRWMQRRAGGMKVPGHEHCENECPRCHRHASNEEGLVADWPEITGLRDEAEQVRVEAAFRDRTPGSEIEARVVFYCPRDDITWSGVVLIEGEAS